MVVAQQLTISTIEIVPQKVISIFIQVLAYALTFFKNSKFYFNECVLGESSWPDTTKQQFNKSNSPESSRKNQNNKYQNSRNNHQGKFQNKTGQFTSFKTNDSINGGDHAEHQSGKIQCLNVKKLVTIALVRE